MFMSVHSVPTETRRGFRSSETVVLDGCNPLPESWESDLCPLQEQQKPVTSEPYL